MADTLLNGQLLVHVPVLATYNGDDDDDSRWSHAAPLRKALTLIQYAYPMVMLSFFLAAFTFRSIAASRSNTNIAKPTTTGPGGKPLPATDPTRNFIKKTVNDDVTHRQKRLFEWVSLAAALTFVGNSAVVIMHSIIWKEEHYWAGKSTVVRVSASAVFAAPTATTAVALPCV